jgi:endonuclease YncB( thermonuclease family)
MTGRTLFSAICFSSMSACCLAADAYSGMVIDIIDGDTLTLVDERSMQHRIRLSGIEAPKRDQRLSAKSTANLGALAFGNEANANCRGKDRNGRELCVLLIDGVDIGLAQIKEGMARNATEASVNARATYRAAEQSARQRGTGIWLASAPRSLTIGAAGTAPARDR